MTPEQRKKNKIVLGLLLGLIALLYALSFVKFGMAVGGAPATIS
jgi:hypothetical protein